IGSLHCRAQIADSSRAAPALACRRLMVADAFLAGAIEIVIAREAELDRALDKRLADRVAVRDVGHAERAVDAMECIGAASLVLGALEIWQHIFERPAGIAELAPMVEILGLPADIDHAVDRRGGAEHLAARPEHPASAGARIGLGLVAPIDRRVGKGLAETERDVNPAVAILAACLEQEHASCRVLAEPRRHRASGRTRADYDEIGLDLILLCRHVRLLHEWHRSA